MDLKKTALVLIDMQKESKFGLENMDGIVEKTADLIAECRKNGIPVIHTRHVNRSDGKGLANNEPVNEQGEPIYYNAKTDDIEILDGIEVTEDDIVIDKQRWSGFYETNLDLMLRDMGIKNIIIGGFVTDGCLMTSLLDAYFRDYNIHLIKDICATTNEGAHKSSILIMANWVYGIRIYNANDMINRLKGNSYHVWEATEPDLLRFTPETLWETFEKLNK